VCVCVFDSLPLNCYSYCVGIRSIRAVACLASSFLLTRSHLPNCLPSVSLWVLFVCEGKSTGPDKKLIKTLNANYEALSKSPTSSSLSSSSSSAFASTSPFGPLTESASRKVRCFATLLLLCLPLRMAVDSWSGVVVVVVVVRVELNSNPFQSIVV
jgi:hypothetical protein